MKTAIRKYETTPSIYHNRVIMTENEIGFSGIDVLQWERPKISPQIIEKLFEEHGLECFNNGDEERNGERWFFEQMHEQDIIESIYDVGSSNNSIYTKFAGEVHYFEPSERIKELASRANKNTKSYYSNVGLSDITSDKRKIIWETQHVHPGHILSPTVFIRTVTGFDYMSKNGFDKIDFVKLDTEGHELAILKGFKEYLSNVKIIQFEYGGSAYACDISLHDIISYLEKFGFCRFSYLAPDRLEPLNWTKDSVDHYTFCNIVCFNKNYLGEDFFNNVEGL
tara:strand:+ start:8897 stop:9739 length:843 start_codon:yes stop_codon:yes gene_type:complete